MTPSVQLFPITGMPMVRPGDDLAGLILSAVGQCGIGWESGDILVVAQKIVSKSEGRIRDLASITPSPFALELAKVVDKDPSMVELILSESKNIIRARKNVLIVETRSGLICANAGIDQSNVEGKDRACLLPEDPDRSARRLREALESKTGLRIAVVISDTFGRPWRLGQTNAAIGFSGLPPFRDERGKTDLTGKVMEDTCIAEVDQLASAAGMLMKKSGAVPAVLIRGFPPYPGEEGPSGSLLRPPGEDLFR